MYLKDTLYVFINWKLCLLNMYIISFLSSPPRQSTCYLPTVVAIVHFLRVLSLMERQQYPFTQFWRYELTSIFFVLLDVYRTSFPKNIMCMKKHEAQLSLYDPRVFICLWVIAQLALHFPIIMGWRVRFWVRLMCMYNTITYQSKIKI